MRNPFSHNNPGFNPPRSTCRPAGLCHKVAPGWNQHGKWFAVANLIAVVPKQEINKKKTAVFLFWNWSDFRVIHCRILRPRFCNHTQECPKFRWFQLRRSPGLQVCWYVRMEVCVCVWLCMHVRRKLVSKEASMSTLYGMCTMYILSILCTVYYVFIYLHIFF